MGRKLTTEKLGRKRSYGVSLRQNQIRTLFTTGILRTTTSKAKNARSMAQSLLSEMSEKDITLAKRRKFKTVLGKKDLVEKALKYAQNEDYGVRVIKVGFRPGDNAELSRVELIGFEGKRKRKVAKKEKEEEALVKESKKGRKPNKDIDERGPRKSASGKATKASRKATERVRTRSGL